MNSLPDKLEQMRANYNRLAQSSQNPHADPVLKSLRFAIEKLERQLERIQKQK